MKKYCEDCEYYARAIYERSPGFAHYLDYYICTRIEFFGYITSDLNKKFDCEGFQLKIREKPIEPTSPKRENYFFNFTFQWALKNYRKNWLIWRTELEKYNYLKKRDNQRYG